MDNRNMRTNANRAQRSAPAQTRPVNGRNSAAVAPKRGQRTGNTLPVRRNGNTAMTVRKSNKPSITARVWNVVKGSMSSGKSDMRIKTVKSKKKTPIPITAIIMSLICTLLFMFLIMSYVQINEYTLEVSNLRSDLSALASSRKELTYELDEKNDMLAIEQYATENLHMVKIDQLTKKHITIDRDDKIEVVETEPSHDSTVVTTMMSAFFSNFNGLLEYLK